MALYLHDEDIRRDSLEQGKIEAKQDDILELLEDEGKITRELKEKIRKQSDFEILSKWLKLAARSTSIEEFESQIG